MATHATHAMPETGWNWLRISSLSGSVAVHVFAIALLILPVAVPTPQVQPVVTHASIITEPAEPVVVQAPPPPVAKPVPHRPSVKAVVTPRPIIDEMRAFAEPVVAAAAAAGIIEPAAPDVANQVAQSGASNARLAYESTIEPRYPIEARRRGEQGTVLLRVLVGRDGLPIDIKVARSSGYRSLDRAAREAVLRWRFRPVQVNGMHVEALGLVPIRFDVNQG